MGRDSSASSNFVQSKPNCRSGTHESDLGYSRKRRKAN